MNLTIIVLFGILLLSIITFYVIFAKPPPAPAPSPTPTPTPTPTPSQPEKEKGCYVNIQGNCSAETDGRYVPGTYTPGTWVLDSADIDEAACINRRTNLEGCGFTRSRFNGSEDGMCEIKIAGNCSASTDGRYAPGTYTPGTWVFDSYKNTAADCTQRKTDLAGCGSVETRFEHSE